MANKIDIFKQLAKSQGYSDNEVNSFAAILPPESPQSTKYPGYTEEEAARAISAHNINNTPDPTETYNFSPSIKPGTQAGEEEIAAGHQQDLINDMVTTGGKGRTAIESYYATMKPSAAKLKEVQIQTDKQKAIDLKNQMMTEIKNKAQAVKNVIELGRQGKLTGEQYKTALGQVSSDFNKQALFAKEDKVAGSALTAIELAQLGGGIIGTSSRTQNAIDKLTGYNPAPQSKVEDSEDVVTQKMDYILTGQPPINAEGQVDGKEKINWNLPENILNNAETIVRGIPSLAEAAWNMSPPGGFINTLQGNSMKGIESGKAIREGVIEDLSKSTGISRDKTGWKFDPKQALIHNYNNPINTLGYLSMAKSGLKSLKGAKTLPPIEEANLGKTSTIPKGTDIGPIQGRIATKVGVVDMADVAKSENLMKQSLQMTKSLTRRGMAKELDQFIPKAGEAIDKWVSIKDAQIGKQPLNEITNTLTTRLSQTPAGMNNPDAVGAVMRVVEQKAGIGDSTTLTKLNEARKFLNQKVSRGFERGQLTPEEALWWDASEGIKDIMKEADNTNADLAQTINQQHVAISTKPVLSKLALTYPPSHSIWQFIFNNLNSALNMVKEPVQIGLSRLSMGKGINPLPGLQNLPKGELPPIEENSIFRGLQNKAPMQTLPPVEEGSATLKRPSGYKIPTKGTLKKYKPGSVPKKSSWTPK